MGAAGARVLLVEDDVDFAEVLAEGLEEAGMEVQQAADGKEALNRLRDGQFDLILSDAQMQPMDGYGLLAALRAQPGHPPVVMMTAWGTIDEAVRALQNGAVDYLVKPFAMQELLTKLQRHERLQPGAELEPLAHSPVMLETLIKARRVAQTEASVLLTGESGVGKEVLARFIHRESNRAREPFVAVNCAAIPESLLEATLFGHEKGAFTGAHSRKIGLAEAAHGGTLFLDEVGDIPLALQVKLLRLLETGQFRRVGGVEPIHSDFRLISATHRDLEKMVTEERFRRDLYYRVNMFPIVLPPLRERREDIDALAEALLHRLPEGRRLRLHPDTLACLRNYDYPGNIRELRNILGRAALLADELWILPEHLPPHLREGLRKAEPPSLPGQAAAGAVPEILPLAELEAQYLRWARDNFPGDRRSLAHRLGVSERTLYRKLDQLDAHQSHVPPVA